VAEIICSCGMKLPVRLRWAEFLLAVAAVVAVIVFTERSAWQQISRLRKGLRPEAIERVRSADRLRSTVLEMHATWELAMETGKAGNQTSFELIGKRLEALVRQQLADPAATQELLDKIATEQRAYQALAARALTELKTRTTGSAPARNDEVEGHLSRLLALCEELGSANDAAAQRVLKEADTGLTALQRFLFMSLVGLLIFGTVVLILTYRWMVGPLRSSLAESRTLIERQEKLASLGVFAAGIAHEVRNPITAIKVRLFTLKSSHRPGSGESEDLEVIESEINRLERIVQEFLRFARPSEPDLLTMPVDSFLQEVYDLLLPELTKRSIRFDLDLKAKETVRIDPEKMKQVLLNFIQNAADSIEGDGTVTLRSRTDRQTVGGRSLPAVVIEITDTGKGMPPEVTKRLFDPFFTTKEKGTGLGLPIAARIVEKHGGLIQYRTEVDKGTTFSILLPRANS